MIYRQIAKKHGVTVEEVRKEIQAAIDAAYLGEKDGITEAYQQQVPHNKGEVPTPEELIRHLIRESRNRKL